MEERKVLEGPRPREEIFGASLGSEMSARSLLDSASFLNFRYWVIPGGVCHVRSGWGAVNESGAMDLWRPGRSRSSAQAKVAEQLRNDMLRRRKMLSVSGADAVAQRHVASYQEAPVRKRRRVRVAPAAPLPL